MPAWHGTMAEVLRKMVYPSTPPLMRFVSPKGLIYTVGQQHAVQVANVDMELQRVDFKFID